MIAYDPRIHDWQGGLRNLAVAGTLLIWMVFIRPIGLRNEGTPLGEGTHHNAKGELKENAARK